MRSVLLRLHVTAVPFVLALTLAPGIVLGDHRPGHGKAKDQIDVEVRFRDDAGDRIRSDGGGAYGGSIKSGDGHLFIGTGKKRDIFLDFGACVVGPCAPPFAAGFTRARFNTRRSYIDNNPENPSTDTNFNLCDLPVGESVFCQLAVELFLGAGWPDDDGISFGKELSIAACDAPGATSPTLLSRTGTDTWTLETLPADDVGCLRNQHSDTHEGSYRLPFHIAITALGAGCPAGGGGAALSAAPPARFLRGDANADGALDIADVTTTLDWLFLGTVEIDCPAAANTNGDHTVDVTDALATLGYLFKGCYAPPPPFPRCGPGTLFTDEAMECHTSPARCR